MRAHLDMRIPIPAQALAVNLVTALLCTSWWVEYRVHEGITTNLHFFWEASSHLAPMVAGILCVFMLISHFRERQSYRCLVYLTAIFATTPWIFLLSLLFTA